MLYDADRYPTANIRYHQRQVLAAQVHPEGNFFVAAGYDFSISECSRKRRGRGVFFWDSQPKTSCSQLVTMHKWPITEIRFSPDGQNIFVASIDGDISHWSCTSMGFIQQFRGHTNRVNSVNLNCYSNLICTGSDDGTTKIWDVRTGRNTHTFRNMMQHAINSVTFDASGERVFSAAKNFLDFWDLRAAACMKTLVDHDGLVTGTSVSPDGAFLLTNSQDDTLRVWDIRTAQASEGRCINIYRGHQHDKTNKGPRQLLRCAWSFDSYYVTAGSADGILCVWNKKWQTPIAMIDAHEKSITGVDFHPKGNIIMSGSIDARVFWQDLSNRENYSEEDRRKSAADDEQRRKIDQLCLNYGPLPGYRYTL